MKAILPFLFAAGLACGADFDTRAFGDGLNGWRHDGAAHYTVGEARYRTRKPVVDVAPDGSLRVGALVSHFPNRWAELPCTLELSFDDAGTLTAARIHGSIRGRKIDTGAVGLPEAPLVEEGKQAVPFDPDEELAAALIDSFASQAAAAAEAEDTRKRDLAARIAGPEPVDPAAMSAGLRHNLVLMLRCVRGGPGSK